MNSKKNKIFYWASAVLLAAISSLVQAEEIIIQEEKMSFERCLSVIETSANKLSIAPEISDITDQHRIAIFKLSDGTLTISCKGKEELVTVSTKTN